MTADQRPADKELDELLKRALADDLPADVETGMRRTIARFREGTERKRGEKARGKARERAARDAREGRRAAGWAWMLGRGAAAVLSILMLLAGILLQGRGAQSSLAGRIAQVKTEFTGR